jgi:hypothetical protein
MLPPLLKLLGLNADDENCGVAEFLSRQTFLCEARPRQLRKPSWSRDHLRASSLPPPKAVSLRWSLDARRATRHRGGHGAVELRGGLGRLQKPRPHRGAQATVRASVAELVSAQAPAHRHRRLAQGAYTAASCKRCGFEPCSLSSVCSLCPMVAGFAICREGKPVSQETRLGNL